MRCFLCCLLSAGSSRGPGPWDAARLPCRGMGCSAGFDAPIGTAVAPWPRERPGGCRQPEGGCGHSCLIAGWLPRVKRASGVINPSP